MLSLSEVQQWHHSSFLVLRGVSFEDLIDELVVLLRELEWYACIILGAIAMLEEILLVCELRLGSVKEVLTT